VSGFEKFFQQPEILEIKLFSMEDFNEFKMGWFKKCLMRFAPRLFLKRAAKEQGVDRKKLDYAMELFGESQRIDIQPLPSRSGRGFVIYLDNKFSLHFYQNGDHFYFDGFEIGEYENGDVTVFDNLDL
jgi:hypothetical protein